MYEDWTAQQTQNFDGGETRRSYQNDRNVLFEVSGSVATFL